MRAILSVVVTKSMALAMVVEQLQHFNPRAEAGLVDALVSSA